MKCVCVCVGGGGGVLRAEWERDIYVTFIAQAAAKVIRSPISNDQIISTSLNHGS